MDMDMEPQHDSGAGGCLARIVSWVVKLILLAVVIVVLYMAYIVVFGGVGGVVPDWMMKGYSNKSYRAAEKHMKNEEYELAVHEFEKVLAEKTDNAAMIKDTRLNLGYCYEQIGDSVEALTYQEGPEGNEARRKQKEAYDRAFEQYSILLKENSKDKTAQMRRDLLLMKRG